MPFVLDTSVALAWHFRDEASDYTESLLERVRRDSAVVPSLWPVQLANGLLVAERCGRIQAADVAYRIDLTLTLPITVREVSSELALGAVLNLARSQNLTVYDAAYLELAMREGLELATQDEDLRAAAEQLGVPLAE